MHPLVLLQDDICRYVNELGQIRRDLTEAQEKFKTLFERTEFYKELIEKYGDDSDIDILWFDEDSLALTIDYLRLEFDTQEIGGKLNVHN